MSDPVFEAMLDRYREHIKRRGYGTIHEDAMRFAWDAAIEYKADAAESLRTQGEASAGAER